MGRDECPPLEGSLSPPQLKKGGYCMSRISRGGFGPDTRVTVRWGRCLENSENIRMFCTAGEALWMRW